MIHYVNKLKLEGATMANNKQHINNKWLVADFETTVYETYLQEGKTRVWLWAIAMPNGKPLVWGQTIEEFFDTIKDYNGFDIYFHNLRFDGSFIINYLLENNFEFTDKIEKSDTKKFSTLIADNGAWYVIEVALSTRCHIKFIDSLKLLPFSVDKIAKDFGFEEQKLKIDYSDYTINEHTVEYVYHDVIIVAKALSEIKSQGIDKLTIASSAYHYYKGLSGRLFNQYFPRLTDEMLTDYRKAYRGGRSQVNPLHARKILNDVKRFDINSMYPHIMRNLPLPYGLPVPINKRHTYDFELYKVNISFNLKVGHLPTLLKKGGMTLDDTYYICTEDVEEIYISSLDYDLLEKHYDITYVEFVEMWGFNCAVGLFKKYVDYWYDMKVNNKGAKRVIAKLMLNSLYGKFGTKPKCDSKKPVLSEDGLEFERIEDTGFKAYYLPLAIAITSWAHVLIDDAICATGYDNFVYCDTDSVHTLGTLPEEMISQDKLGKFKLEAIEKQSKYVRQKTYVYSEYVDGELEYFITACGLNQKSKDYAIATYKENIFDIFDFGFSVEGLKLMPKQVRGGCVLVPSDFNLREGVKKNV